MTTPRRAVPYPGLKLTEEWEVDKLPDLDPSGIYQPDDVKKLLRALEAPSAHEARTLSRISSMAVNTVQRSDFEETIADITGSVGERISD